MGLQSRGLAAAITLGQVSFQLGSATISVPTPLLV